MKMDKITSDNLIKKAREIREHAYTPYSKYKVGAALLGKSGNIYLGANIENAIYRVTHAERLALDLALLNGERELKAIAVVTDDELAPFPCGQCLQDLTESDFDGLGKLIILGANLKGAIKESKLAELLPHRFGPINLGINIKEH